MSDFLHNLRNGNVGNRYDRPRKNYENQQYRPMDRHQGRDKRSGAQRKTHPSEQLTLIKKILEEIQESQRELVRSARERATAEKRMADALEAIAGRLAGTLVADAPNPDPMPLEAEPTVPAAEAAPEISPAPEPVEPAGGPEPAVEAIPDRREAALAAIHQLREQGLTYEKIARQLEAEKIPTISGRGRWRGQAVSKLLAEI